MICLQNNSTWSNSKICAPKYDRVGASEKEIAKIILLREGGIVPLASSPPFLGSAAGCLRLRAPPQAGGSTAAAQQQQMK
jgi:hypothetical protein